MSAFDRRGSTLKRWMDESRERARRAGERLLERTAELATTASNESLAEPGPEPPVVARLVVEIRSDGSRTIARGGLEDVVTGQKVAVRADGTTPAQLARSLAATLLTVPVFAARIARSLKHGPGESPEDE